jgi:hypothetical protein
MTNDLDAYYGLARPGTLACIQRTDAVYGDQFIFTRVTEAASGKIKTAYGTFWAINGECIDRRWGGTANRLVLPTMTRVEAEEANLQSLYQFGADRKFELAAARAVLERRMTKMPNVPPPPTPTLEEAEAELRDATAYWMSIDQILDSPGNSIRLRREASERLATARTNFQLASEAQGRPPKRSNKFDRSGEGLHNENYYGKRGNGAAQNHSDETSVARLNFYNIQNNVDAARYTFNFSTTIGGKKT